MIGGKREAHRALVADNDRGAHSHTNATVGKLLEEGIALAELATRPRAPGTDAA